MLEVVLRLPEVQQTYYQSVRSKRDVVEGELRTGGKPQSQVHIANRTVTPSALPRSRLFHNRLLQYELSVGPSPSRSQKHVIRQCDWTEAIR